VHRVVEKSINRASRTARELAGGPTIRGEMVHSFFILCIPVIDSEWYFDGIVVSRKPN